MPALSLYITDAALREAVIEQIDAAKFCAPRLADSVQKLLENNPGETGRVLILDHGAYDKKTAALLRDAAQQANPPVALLLGSAEDSDGIAESFALPLRLGHLIARLRYYLETAPLLRDRVISFGGYRLETRNRCLVVDPGGAVTRLTEKETALLALLAASPQPLTRRDILAEIWGYDERIDTHTLETHIYQLRRKLDLGGGKDGGNGLIFEAGAYSLRRG